MTILPIVARELRVASRRRVTFRSRVGAALMATLMSGWMLLVFVDLPPARLGKTVFIAVACLAFVYCLFAGARTTADCLGEERRDGTMGLLFLTDLRGHDIVLGKLAATSLGALYGLLAVFPVLAIPIPLGGVTAAEFVRVTVVLLGTLFMSLSVGIGVSAIVTRARAAAGVAFGAVLLLNTAGLLVAAGYRLWAGTWPVQLPMLQVPSAGFALAVAFEEFHPRLWHPYLAATAYVWLIGVIGLWVASWAVGWTWRDRPAGRVGQRWMDRLKAYAHGDGAERARYRGRLLSMNAIYWLTARDRLKPAWVWGVLGLLVLGWLYGALELGREWFDPGLHAVTASILMTVMKLWVATEGGSRFLEDRRTQALELLLTTPLTERDMVGGNWLGLMRQFRGPAVGVLGLSVALMVLPVFTGDQHALDGRWFAMFVLAMIVFVVDLAALMWTGMWLGLSARRPNQVSAGVIGRVLVLPWVVHILVIVGVALVDNMAWLDRSLELSESFHLGLWTALGLATDVGFIYWSRGRLLREMRALAASRHGVASEEGWSWLSWVWPGKGRLAGGRGATEVSE